MHPRASLPRDVHDAIGVSGGTALRNSYHDRVIEPGIRSEAKKFRGLGPFHLKAGFAQSTLHQVGDSKTGNGRGTVTDHNNSPDWLSVIAAQPCSEGRAIAKCSGMKLHAARVQHIFAAKGSAHADTHLHALLFNEVIKL